MPLQSFSAAEKILTERRRMERPLLMLILLSVGSFSVGEGKLFYLLAAMLAVGVNLAATFHHKEVYLSRRYVNMGVLVATGILLAELIALGVDERVALGHFLVLIMLCKLFEHKSNRDYLQMLGMSLLLMVAASLLTVDLWFALATLTFLVLVCYTAMVFTLKRGLDAVAAAQLAGEKAPLAPQRLAWNVVRDWPARPLRSKMIVVLLALAAFAAANFLLLPRYPSSSAPKSPRDSAAELGFAKQMTLGSPKELYLSNQELMRVKLSGTLPRQAVELWGYFRAQTFENYADSRWSASDSSPKVSLRVPQASGELLTQEIRLGPSLLPNLFCLYPAVEVSVEGGDFAQCGLDLNWKLGSRTGGSRWVRYTARSLPTPLRPDQIAMLEPRRGDAYVGMTQKARLQTTQPWHPESRVPGPATRSSSQTVYENVARASWPRGKTATSAVGTTAGHEGETPSPQLPASFHTRSQTADTVEATDRVRELARRWCQDLVDKRGPGKDSGDGIDLQIAQRIAQKLKSNYAYSLDLTDADPNVDALDDFLFTMKRGHCEYFASAMTVMCRTLGVRARLATGFHIDADNARGDEYIVRGRDAHAWTEVYTPSTGWTVFDATGSAGRNLVKSGWWVHIQEFWSDLKSRWRDQIVGYDDKSHYETLLSIRSGLAWAWQAISDWLERVKQALTQLILYGEVDRVLLQLLGALTVVALTAEGALIHRAIRQRRKLLAAGVEGAAYRLEFFVQLQALLGRQGVRREPPQTFRELADLAARKLRVPPESIAGLIELYYRVRWGAAAASDQELQSAMEQVRELRVKLAGRKKDQ